MRHCEQLSLSMTPAYFSVVAGLCALSELGLSCCFFFFFFQAEDGIRDHCVTGVQTCALPIWPEVGAAAVVLEAGEDPRARAEVGLDRDVADQPRARVADRLQVDQPQPWQLLLTQLVGVAEQDRKSVV